MAVVQEMAGRHGAAEFVIGADRIDAESLRCAVDQPHRIVQPRQVFPGVEVEIPVPVNDKGIAFRRQHFRCDAFDAVVVVARFQCVSGSREMAGEFGENCGREAGLPVRQQQGHHAVRTVLPVVGRRFEGAAADLRHDEASLLHLVHRLGDDELADAEALHQPAHGRHRCSRREALDQIAALFDDVVVFIHEFRFLFIGNTLCIWCISVLIIPEIKRMSIGK